MNLFLVLLLGCQTSAEVRAKDWIRKHEPTAPIYSLYCEDKSWGGDGRVDCTIQIEEIGRIFTYKLKCYNSNKPPSFDEGCIEALDDQTLLLHQFN